MNTERNFHLPRSLSVRCGIAAEITIRGAAPGTGPGKLMFASGPIPEKRIDLRIEEHEGESVQIVVRDRGEGGRQGPKARLALIIPGPIVGDLEINAVSCDLNLAGVSARRLLTSLVGCDARMEPVASTEAVLLDLVSTSYSVIFVAPLGDVRVKAVKGEGYCRLPGFSGTLNARYVGSEVSIQEARHTGLGTLSRTIGEGSGAASFTLIGGALRVSL